MKKLRATLVATGLALISQSAFSAASVAVAHFAPFAEDIEDTAVNISVNGSVALENVKFKEFTDYMPFDPGTYMIEITPVGATDPAISAEVVVQDETSYSIIAVGNGITQPLGAIVLADDVDAPAEGNLNLRVVHTAPFAADLDDTQVSIRTAAGDIVNNLESVPYLVNSGFFEVPAGTYDLKVASPDGSVNYIDPLPAGLPAGADVTIYAVGDGINQPLGIIAFPVGELPLRTPVDNRYNGMWMIQEGTGTGYVFQPMPSQNRVVGAWYTYDMEGNPTFLTFDSCDAMDDGMGGETCMNPGGFDGMMATTTLYASSGGGPGEDDMVETVRVGEIDFEILTCLDATATVRLDGADPVTYTASQLTAPFPCAEPAPAE